MATEDEGRPVAGAARLWARPAVGWRLAALGLAWLPQFLISSPPPVWPDGPDEAVIGQGFATATVVAESDLREDWFDYLGTSGALLIVLAVAFMLPGTAGRRATFGAAWLLAGLGVVAGSFGVGPLMAHCLFYLVAAALLAVAGVRTALSRG